MAPSQDQTPPPMGREHRPNLANGNRFPSWVYVIAIAVGLTSIILVVIGHRESPYGTGPLTTVGKLLVALELSIIFATPGALVALQHPSVASARRVLAEHYNHARLLGLAEVWAGLVMSGWVCLVLFPNLSILSLPVGLELLLWAGVVLVSLGPLLAIALFDRRR
jgi:hypothetical protein